MLPVLLRLSILQHHTDTTLSVPSNSVTAMSRPRRAVATTTNHVSPPLPVSCPPSDAPDDRRRSLKLTVKLPGSRLREMTRRDELAGLKDSLGGGEILTGRRKTARTGEKKRYVEYVDSEIEEDEDELVEEELENETAEDGAMDDFEQMGAEAEGTDDEDAGGELDEDVAMEGVSLPPHQPVAAHQVTKITFKTTPKSLPTQRPNPTLIVTTAAASPRRSVEGKEMDLDPEDDEDDELSELDSDLEEEDQTETALDAEGDDDGAGEEEGADCEDEDLEGEGLGDSDDETPGSGAATPDLSKMTKRQRGRQDEEGGFMALPMEPQIKK